MALGLLDCLYAARSPMRHSKHLRFFEIVVLAAISFVTVWVILWGLFAYHVDQQATRWIDAERAQGHQVTFSDRTLSGFPGAAAVHFKDFKWQHGGYIRFQTEVLNISAGLLSWNSFRIYQGKNSGLTVSLPGKGDLLNLQTVSGDFSISLRNDGAWERIITHFDLAHVSNISHELFLAQQAHITVERPDHPPIKHTDRGLRVTLDLSDIKMGSANKTPFDNNFYSAIVGFIIKGPAPDSLNKKALEEWNNNGGISDFLLLLRWNKSLAEMKGSLALTKNLQPEGAFAGKVYGLKDAIQDFVDVKWIEKPEAALINAFINEMTKSEPSKAQAAIETPLTIQSGGLFIGPVRVLTMPTIDWPQ